MTPPSPCPTTTPPYYPLTLHIIAGISIPVNFIGFYLVCYQSPKMKGYKYCLLYLQFVSFITELYMSWICPGYYFFPMPGGYNTGAQFISSHLSVTLYTFIFAFELPSALLCFIFRHSAAEQLCRTTPRKQYFEKFALVLCHIFPFAASFVMWKPQLTMEQKYEYMNENWPECINWLSLNAFEVYDYKLNPWLTVLGVGVISFVLTTYTYGLSLGFHTMWILQNFRKSMSSQTYQMHKTALFSLLMQLLIPGVLIVIPLCFCTFVIVTGAVWMQEIATDTMFLVGSHSTCSCVVMILSNPRYRKFLISKILRKKSTGVENSGSSVKPMTRQRTISLGTVQRSASLRL